LSIVAYDYGGETGNLKNISLSYSVQTSPPVITPITPINGATYTSTAGSMLKLKFTATDGNGISSCSYSLTGPVTINTTSVSCVENSSTQLYLSAGTYNLLLSATDGSGMITVSNISFTVTDTTAPVITNNSTTPTSNNAVLSVNTDESATCKYDTVDLPYADMRKTFTNNISKHTTTLTLEKDKVYDYYVRCMDLSSNANKESLQVTLLYGTAPVENKTVVKVDPTDTYDLGTVPVGTKVVSVDKAGIPILSLIITTSKLANGVSLKLTAVSKPEETYSEKVYKYITVEHAALSDDSITNVKIKFSVEKKWLIDNNVNSNDIVLLRYDSNGWTPLNTNLTRESDDGTEVLYLADSPGLSLFAISKKVPPVVAVTAVATVDNTTSNNTVVNNSSTELFQLEKRNINWFWVITLSVIVFIVLILFVLIQKNDRENPPIFPEDRTIFGRIRRLFK
jgi:PGF-pre-PGF domain-containing protein